MKDNKKELNKNNSIEKTWFKFFKRKGYILFFAAIITVFTSCNMVNNKQFSNNISSGDLREQHWIDDIDYLHENLPKSHKNLYHIIKEEDFDKEILDLKNDVPKLKDYEIKCRLAQIVASVGDAHTSLNLGFNNSNVYPLKLYWFDADLRVVTADKDHKDILGKKLININGIPIDEIMTKVNSLISHENDQWLNVKNVQYIMMPDVLKLLSVTSEDKVEFSFEDDSNNISKIELYPSNPTSDNTLKIMDEMPIKPLRLQFNPDNTTERLYWYKYIPEDKILYFQYNECIDRKVAKEYGYSDYESYPDFDDFSNGLLKEITDNNIDKFVVDLRNNTGGNSTLMTTLISKLNQIDKLKDKGKIFVLVGRQTFSSGVMAAIDFLYETKAIFYGESTGGNVNGYGDILNLVLPYSKLQISYSTKYFQLSDKYKEGFIPDTIIDQSFDHYKKGIDDVYDAIKIYTN